MRRRAFLSILAGAAAAPGALAQSGNIPAIGFLTSRAPAESASQVGAFLRGLKDSGIVAGQDVAIAYRYAAGHYDNMPALAAELLRTNVTALVAAGGSASALAAKAATTTVPVVFLIGNDAVRLGLVDSYNRPGANLTGITFVTTELGSKRIGLLFEMLPALRRVALLQNSANPDTAYHRSEVEAAADATGRALVALDATTSQDIDRAFARLKQASVGALIVQNDPFFDSERDRILRLAALQRVPAIYHIREFPESGGLMSYGASLLETYHLLGIQTARVLRGATPRDLPVLRPTRFELIANLRTARDLGIAVPESILARADEVIE